ncbi:uncharacterized protein DS421_4g126510 [Arachis hypogaea]|nr:uncharacterized protein DS421_4g126510 [Arachis hypogaea]
MDIDHDYDQVYDEYNSSWDARQRDSPMEVLGLPSIFLYYVEAVTMLGTSGSHPCGFCGFQMQDILLSPLNNTNCDDSSYGRFWRIGLTIADNRPSSFTHSHSFKLIAIHVSILPPQIRIAIFVRSCLRSPSLGSVPILKASLMVAGKSNMEVKEVLDQMLTHLALCDDCKLEPLLSNLLPICISSLSLNSTAVCNKVLLVVT